MILCKELRFKTKVQIPLFRYVVKYGRTTFQYFIYKCGRKQELSNYFQNISSLVRVSVFFFFFAYFGAYWFLVNDFNLFFIQINAFINCFVGVWKITTLFDLETAICKNEGVQQFEELELGPLIRHPLINHYFCVSSDSTKVFKISGQEILRFLVEFMDVHKGKEVKADELLDFIAEKRSVDSKEKLHVRIQSLGYVFLFPLNLLFYTKIYHSWKFYYASVNTKNSLSNK